MRVTAHAGSPPQEVALAQPAYPTVPMRVTRVGMKDGQEEALPCQAVLQCLPGRPWRERGPRSKPLERPMGPITAVGEDIGVDVTGDAIRALETRTAQLLLPPPIYAQGRKMPVA